MIQELIHLAEPVVQEASFGVIAIASAAVAVTGSVVGAVSAGKSERRARTNKNRLTGELEELEKNRQDVINPYEGVTDLSSMVSDLSSIASNPYQNLAVSTAAAEMTTDPAHNRRPSAIATSHPPTDSFTIFVTGASVSKQPEGSF